MAAPRSLHRLEHGQGTEEDLEKLLDICDNILGRAFCALGDGATAPITSSIQYFREEYIAHLTNGGCPFDPRDARRCSRRTTCPHDDHEPHRSPSAAATPSARRQRDPAAPPVTLTIDGVPVSACPRAPW